MDLQNRTARFDNESGASPANLREVFHRIGDCCHRTAALAVIVRVAGYVWVTPHGEMFDALVQTEYPTIRSGITARAFLDESSALRWLSW